jgi:hypothetical protein
VSAGDVDPMLKSTMEEMSKTALKLVQDVPPGGKLTVSDATLDTAFRAGVDERAEENHVVPDTARWLLSFTNVVLYPFISSIMKSTLFVPYDEYSDWYFSVDLKRISDGETCHDDVVFIVLIIFNVIRVRFTGNLSTSTALTRS